MAASPNTAANQGGCYIFGPFRLDVAATSLFRGGENVPLTPKVFDTLLALVSESGRTLTKDELIERVWPDAAVGDGSLAQNILVLRKLLDPHFPGESPIATFPKRGYQFTAPVTLQPRDVQPREVSGKTLTEPEEPEAPGLTDTPAISPAQTEATRSRWKPRPVVVGGLALLVAVCLVLWVRSALVGGSLAHSVSPRRSMAVLALKNLTAKPEFDWYSTALAETLTSELRADGNLRVISSDNVRRMQQELFLPGVIISRSQIDDIRKDLGCDLIMSGSYLSVGDKIRVELLLSDARSSDTIASITDTDDQNHLLEIVSRIGQQLRSKLGIQPLETAQALSLKHAVSADSRANRFYFDGLAALKLRDGPEAQRQLSLAVETDPSFALAHSALSATWHDLGYSARALKEAKKALDLADTTQSREDRLVVEGQYYECLFDWKKAGETYQSLWRFFPDNIEYGLKLVQIHYAAGEPAEALKVLTQLHAGPLPDSQDPRIDLMESIGDQLSGNYQRAYDAATRSAQKAETAKARILLAQARVKQGLSAARLGRTTEARQHYSEAKALFEAVGDTRDAADALTLDAESLRAVGDTDAAIREFETALAMSRKIGFTHLTNRILAAYSNVLLITGSLEQARKACEEALASNSEINDVGTAFTVLMDRAGIAKAQGRYLEARADLVEGIRITRQAGYRLEASNAGSVLGVVDTSLGHLTDARRELDEVIAQKRAMGNRGSLAASLNALAVVLRAQDDLAGARSVTEQQCAILESAQKQAGLAGCEMMLARLLIDEGRTPEARAALAKITAGLSPESLGPVDLSSLATLQFETGDTDGARRSLAVAQAGLGRRGAIPEWSLAVSLTAAQIARSAPQLEQVALQADRLQNVPVALDARLALVSLAVVESRPTAARLATDAQQRGFALIARKAKSLTTGVNGPLSRN